MFSDILIRPTIQIIPGKVLEIGYSNFGPIVNLSIAILAENKRMLIKDITMDLIHTSKDENKLSWQWYEETLYETAFPEQSVSTKKQQVAIALNLGKGKLVEKKVGFQHIIFKESNADLFSKLTNSYHNIVIQGKGEVNELKKTEEYNRMFDLFKKAFFWKEGVYTVTLKLFSLDRHQPDLVTFNFELTQLDVKSLQYNIGICHMILEDSYGGSTHETVPPWKWVYKNWF